MSYSVTHRGIDSYVRGVVEDVTSIDQNGVETITHTIAGGDTTKTLYAAQDAMTEAWSTTDRDDSIPGDISTESIDDVEDALKSYIKDRAEKMEAELVE